MKELIGWIIIQIALQIAVILSVGMAGGALQIAIASILSVGMVDRVTTVVLLMLAQLLIAITLCAMVFCRRRRDTLRPTFRFTIPFLTAAAGYAFVCFSSVASGVLLGLVRDANGSWLSSYGLSLLGSTALNAIVAWALYQLALDWRKPLNTAPMKGSN